MPLRTLRKIASTLRRVAIPYRDDKLAAQVEAGLRIYAIGDIHGRLDLLRKMQDLIRIDLRDAPARSSCAIFLGDYVDRGPSSRGVLEQLIEEPSVCDKNIFLRGNHEEVLLDFLENAAVLAEWSQFGGLETLYSYGVHPQLPLKKEEFIDLQQEFRNRLPQSQREFLQAMPNFYQVGGYYFVHAGVRPGVALSKQRPGDLLWIKDDFLYSKRRHERLIVHGHTPVEVPEFLPNRINVDTGAYLTGHLSCAVLEEGTRGLIMT